MGDGDTNVNVQNVNGSDGTNVNLSMEDGRKTAPTNETTAESLGVSEEQFAKFYDKDKGYNWQGHAKEAEFKLRQKGAAGDEGDKGTEGKPNGTPNAATDDAAREAAGKAGLDINALGQKIIDKGDIDESDYAALEKAGIPKSEVKEYIQYKAEKALDHVNAVIEAFGGETGFAKVRMFVNKNLTPEQKLSYEKRLGSSDTFKGAVDELLEKAGLPPVERGGVVETPNGSNGGGSGGLQPYKDQMEMITDQRNPKYKSDPKFREMVYQRARVSTFGVNPRFHTGGL